MYRAMPMEHSASTRAEIVATILPENLVRFNAEWNARCEQRRRPPDEEAEVIWRKSHQEMSKGLIYGWLSADQLDTKFGHGQCRAMVRFAVCQQAHESWRFIDNG